MRTYQLLSTVPNGTYTLRAWARSSGGQTTCQLYANGFEGAEAATAVPTAANWTLVQVSGITVTNGQCKIGLRSDAHAGESVSLDDVEFVDLSVAAPLAQFTVDGQVSATELGTGPGKYQLAATYTGNHLEADRGLQALYVGYTATTLNLLLVGSAESAAGAYRALVLYLNTPGRVGAPARVQLSGGSDGPSPLRHKPTLDMQADYSFRASIGPTSATANDVYFSRVSYVTGTAVTPGNDAYLGAGTKAGGLVMVPATLDLAGSRLAYFNTASLPANTANSGLEIEIPLSALGTAASPVTVGSQVELFAAFTDGDSAFYTDVLPQIPGRTVTLGTNPNFTAIPGNQFITYELGGTLLAGRTAAANSLDFQVFPNPAQASATIAYTVPAGAYLVRLQIGAQITSKKLIIE